MASVYSAINNSPRLQLSFLFSSFFCAISSLYNGSANNRGANICRTWNNNQLTFCCLHDNIPSVVQEMISRQMSLPCHFEHKYISSPRSCILSVRSAEEWNFTHYNVMFDHAHFGFVRPDGYLIGKPYFEKIPYFL